jgi:hypothetical protein
MSEDIRVITLHEVTGAASGIKVTADSRNLQNGNASHTYLCSWLESEGTQCHSYIHLQEGPIAEVGINGITNEILLAIVIDRLEGFQTSKYACEENASALAYLKDGLGMLQYRTKRSIAREVEGTSVE